MKKHISIIITLVGVLLFSAVLTGCGGPKEKAFTKAGMTINLDDTFKEQEDIPDMTAAYVSNDKAVSFLREDFSLLQAYGYNPEEIDINRYLEVVKNTNDWPGEIIEKDGITQLTYYLSQGDQDFEYLVTAVKTSDAFWLIQFGCLSRDFTAYYPKFIGWLKTFKA